MPFSSHSQHCRAHRRPLEVADVTTGKGPQRLTSVQPEAVVMSSLYSCCMLVSEHNKELTFRKSSGATEPSVLTRTQHHHNADLYSE